MLFITYRFEQEYDFCFPTEATVLDLKNYLGKLFYDIAQTSQCFAGNKRLSDEMRLIDSDLQLSVDDIPVHREPAVPDDLICPLCYAIFYDPVCIQWEPTKITVERGAIEKWLREHENQSPFDRSPLSLDKLETDLEKKNQVDEYIKLHQNNLFFEKFKPHPFVMEESTISEEDDSDELAAVHAMQEEEEPSREFRSLAYPRFSSSRGTGSHSRMFRSLHTPQFELKLCEIGFTSQMLEEFIHTHDDRPLTIRQFITLNYLVTGQVPYGYDQATPIEEAHRLNPEEALTEISTLSPDELDTLISFYTQGLRGAHFREMERTLLLEMITDQNASVPEALSYVRQRNSFQEQASL